MIRLAYVNHNQNVSNFNLFREQKEQSRELEVRLSFLTNPLLIIVMVPSIKSSHPQNLYLLSLAKGVLQIGKLTEGKPVDPKEKHLVLVLNMHLRGKVQSP